MSCDILYYWEKALCCSRVQFCTNKCSLQMFTTYHNIHLYSWYYWNKTIYIKHSSHIPNFNQLGTVFILVWTLFWEFWKTRLFRLYKDHRCQLNQWSPWIWRHVPHNWEKAMCCSKLQFCRGKFPLKCSQQTTIYTWIVGITEKKQDILTQSKCRDILWINFIIWLIWQRVTWRDIMWKLSTKIIFKSVMGI